MKMVIFSDVHLDASTAGLARMEDVYDSIDEIVRYAVTSEADVLAFLGDCCDPDSLEVHRAVTMIGGRFADARADGVRVLAIPGNHDVVEDGYNSNVLSALAATGTIEQATIPHVWNVGAYRVGALPYTNRMSNYDPRAAASRMNSCDMVVGHLDLPGAQLGSETIDMARGRALEWPIKELDQWAPNALLVGGHYHKHQQVGRVHICGAPDRFTFGEADNIPGFLEVNLQTKSVKHIALQQTKHIATMALAEVKALADAKKGQSRQALGPDLILRIVAPDSADAREVEDAVNRAGGCARYVVQTEKQYDRAARQLAPEEIDVVNVDRIVREFAASWPAAELRPAVQAEVETTLDQVRD